MAENSKEPIRIDLNQFKLHINLKHKLELTLHFNSPSRRFYLSLIAFVVNEMKKIGRITSIPLEEHLDLLALLNETVGGSAGSSSKEHLLPRIYRKWKDALPDLEDAQLFKVLGRKKGYDDAIGKTYQFTEGEKDSWANLFEYKGSGENVRLRFSIDKLGAGLNDFVIVYGEDPVLVNADAWERFTASLKKEVKDKPKPERAYRAFIKEPETPVSQPRKWKIAWPSRLKWPALVAVIGLVVGVATLAVWKFYLYSPQVEVASVEKMAFPLPDRPSIAVMPFTNMSADPEQEFFSDGLTEEIITALSKVPKLFVIARNSTFTYKGKPVKVKQVAEELGVRYVLEGSVRKAGDKIRITVQLIDALNGHHLWAERYDRNLNDIFAVQDEITKKIIMAMQVKLTEGEQVRAAARATNNLEAYLKYLQANEYIHRFNIESNTLGKQLAEEAIALDPEYAWAYKALGRAHMMDVWLGSSKSPKDSIAKAIELVQKAIVLDDIYAEAHGLLGFLYSMTRQYDKALAEAEHAVALNPNSAECHYALGKILVFDGRWEESIPEYKKAIRLNPIPPNTYLWSLGLSYGWTGQYEEAITWCKKAILQEPNSFMAHIMMAVVYGLSGREEEARAEAPEILRINPKFSLEKMAKSLTYRGKGDCERFLDALRKAGLK
jgi:adenylate cyclase